MASWNVNAAKGAGRRQRAWLVLALAFCAYIIYIAARDLLS
jgi:hypothetical protein